MNFILSRKEHKNAESLKYLLFQKARKQGINPKITQSERPLFIRILSPFLVAFIVFIVALLCALGKSGKIYDGDNVAYFLGAGAFLFGAWCGATINSAYGYLWLWSQTPRDYHTEPVNRIFRSVHVHTIMYLCAVAIVFSVVWPSHSNSLNEEGSFLFICLSALSIGVWYQVMVCLTWWVMRLPYAFLVLLIYGALLFGSFFFDAFRMFEAMLSGVGMVMPITYVLSSVYNGLVSGGFPWETQLLITGAGFLALYTLKRTIINRYVKDVRQLYASGEDERDLEVHEGGAISEWGESGSEEHSVGGDKELFLKYLEEADSLEDISIPRVLKRFFTERELEIYRFIGHELNFLRRPILLTITLLLPYLYILLVTSVVSKDNLGEVTFGMLMVCGISYFMLQPLMVLQDEDAVFNHRLSPLEFRVDSFSEITKLIYKVILVRTAIGGLYLAWIIGALLVGFKLTRGNEIILALIFSLVAYHVIATPLVTFSSLGWALKKHKDLFTIAVVLCFIGGFATFIRIMSGAFPLLTLITWCVVSVGLAFAFYKWQIRAYRKGDLDLSK